jgi:hypothetical protein
VVHPGHKAKMINATGKRRKLKSFCIVVNKHEKIKAPLNRRGG